MNASPEAKYAPVGALRIGIALVAVSLFLGFGPIDSPSWLSLTVFVVGALLLATALGIRMLRS
jgi:hypothetical protein